MAARQALAEKERVWSGEVIIVDEVDVMGVVLPVGVAVVGLRRREEGVVVVVVGWRERREEKGREVGAVILKLLLVVSMLFFALYLNIKKQGRVRTESWIAGPFPRTHTSEESRGEPCTGDRASCLTV